MEQATSTFGLIDRFQQGDQEAFSLLFAKYRPRLAVLIHHRLGAELRRTADVDDLLQETFLKAFKEFGRFVYREPGSFFRWLAAIADHTIADAARYQGRKKRHAEELLPLPSPSNPGVPEPRDSNSPSRVFSERTRVERLMNALEALPEDYRRVILLSKIEGFTTAEVADKLSKSREATALLLHRALKRFRQVLDAQRSR